MLYDCHCHLHDPTFDADRPAVIGRARQAGVARALLVAEDLADAERLLAVADAHREFLIPAIGVHPDRAAQMSDEEVADIMSLARRYAGRLAAIGEVGLDYRPCWDASARARQAEILVAMVALAGELDLPLSVHSRSAGRHAIALLERAGATAVCMHGFDGRAVYGEQGAEAGYLFSIPPSLVRSPVKQKLVARLPASALLLESDSPVLGPTPDDRNEPAHLPITLAKIAEIKRQPTAELQDILAGNTVRLFPRLVRADG